ncbi:hypothetical protein [Dokdonella sp.]|uniref:hypothetical protein n=1 Tax=Dokdonella sp. TaxID=2291710 RepID=UPI0031CA921F|nr:hypothetical protein [Dokdonella sp.]
MRTISSLALTLLIAAGTAGAQSAPTLEERMSQSEFQAAGLEKLSPAELAQLNAWLAAHGETQVTGRGGKPLFYPDSDARTTVKANIQGDFTGWLGHTIFRLDNGQEWQQVETSSRHDAGLFHNPAVEIKPMSFGSWLMVVKGCGCSLRVKRIK